MSLPQRKLRMLAVNHSIDKRGVLIPTCGLECGLMKAQSENWDEFITDYILSPRGLLDIDKKKFVNATRGIVT